METSFKETVEKDFTVLEKRLADQRVKAAENFRRLGQQIEMANVDEQQAVFVCNFDDEVIRMIEGTRKVFDSAVFFSKSEMIDPDVRAANAKVLEIFKKHVLSALEGV